MVRIIAIFALASLATACDRSNEGALPDASGGVESAAVAEPARRDEENTMVHWLQPAASDLPLRSEEEKKLGMQVGRTLPRPEPLQPALDSALQPFVPRLDSDVAGSVAGGASDILPGLVLAWIEAFNEIYPNARIEIATPYAGSLGMLEVIAGDYDFVFVSRELKPTDISSFSEKFGYDPFSVPVSGGSYRHYGFLDAMGFFVHVGNPLDRLSFDQIDRLYSSTRHRGGAPIATWGQLGLTGEWKDRPVHLYGVEPWNGFEEFIRQRVLNVGSKRGEWRDDINFSHTAFPLAEQVANDPLAIGYSGLAYITRGVKVLPLAAAPDDDKYVAPSYENIADASYPLSRLVYFNTNKAPNEPMNPVLQELLRFILSREGQQIVLDQAVFLPLRSSQVNEALAGLGSGKEQ